MTDNFQKLKKKNKKNRDDVLKDRVYRRNRKKFRKERKLKRVIETL